MEDMCQLSGRLTEDKYKGSMAQIGKTILRHSTQPGLDAIAFFDLALFCFLTGNADMHPKNFSLWSPLPGEIQLAPAYGLVATKLLLERDPEESALSLHGKKENLRRKDFDALADSMQIQAKARENAYLRMAKAITKWPVVVERSRMSGEMQGGLRRIWEERRERLGLS